MDSHAVLSADWYHPLAADLPPLAADPSPLAADPSPLAAPPIAGERHAALADERRTAEQRCAAALVGRPRLTAEFQQLLRVNQRYAVAREQQARTFTLAWPALRACAQALGRHLKQTGAIGEVEDVFFCTRADLDRATTSVDIAGPRARWERQRRLAAPLKLGRPPRLLGDVIDHAVNAARGSAASTNEDTIVGHPASVGRATGPVNIITDPADFASAIIWCKQFSHLFAVAPLESA